MFDNLSLTIPNQSGCTVDSLLKSYISPEIIHGYICDKCSILATFKHYGRLISQISNSGSPSPTQKKILELYQFLQEAIKLRKYDIEMVYFINAAQRFKVDQNRGQNRQTDKCWLRAEVPLFAYAEICISSQWSFGKE